MPQGLQERRPNRVMGANPGRGTLRQSDFRLESAASSALEGLDVVMSLSSDSRSQSVDPMIYWVYFPADRFLRRRTRGDTGQAHSKSHGGLRAER